MKIKASTRQIFTALAIGMWVMSFLMSMINEKYEPPDYVNPMIMLVGGYLFATANTGKDDKEKSE